MIGPMESHDGHPDCVCDDGLAAQRDVCEPCERRRNPLDILRGAHSYIVRRIASAPTYQTRHELLNARDAISRAFVALCPPVSPSYVRRWGS